MLVESWKFPMPAAMLCKVPTNCRGETCRNVGKIKTKHACIVEADESTRIRFEGAPYRYHKHHIAAKGLLSLSHYNFVHNFIQFLEAFKIPDAKAAVENDRKDRWKYRHGSWRKSETKEVIEEARNEGTTVHFASLMDLCHLKNSEFEPQIQKYKCRVVVEGDIVKDVSGSYAVSTEQGSSASQNDSRKSHGHYFKTARMRRPAAEVKMEDAPDVLQKFQRQNVQICEIMVLNGRPSLFHLKGICAVILCQDYDGKVIWESSIGTQLGKSIKLWMFLCKRTILICVCGRYKYKTGWEETEHWSKCVNSSWKTLIWENQHHSSTMYIWIALKENVR